MRVSRKTTALWRMADGSAESDGVIAGTTVALRVAGFQPMLESVLMRFSLVQNVNGIVVLHTENH